MIDSRDQRPDQSSDTSTGTPHSANAVSRRGFWRSPLGVATGLLVAACGERASFSGRVNASLEHNSGNDSGNDDGSSSDNDHSPKDDLNSKGIGADNGCDPHNAIDSNLSQYGALVVSDGDAPTTLIYDSSPSMMVVVSWERPFANHELTRVALARATGKLIATEAVTEDRYQVSGTIHPLVFDHLRLKKNEEIFLLLTIGEKTFKHSVGKVDDLLTNTFRDRPVINLTAEHVPTDFVTRQGIANFGVSSSYTGFEKANDPRYVFGVRHLRTAQANAEFTSASGLSGFILTDLAGNLIAEDASTFTRLLEHQTLVCYKDGGSVWYRTILTIG